MDIRVTTNEQYFYEVDSQIGALLCAAFPSVFLRVDKKKPATPAPPKVGFGVRNRAAQDGVVAYRVRGATTDFYESWPHAIVKVWPDVPIEVQYEYALGFKIMPFHAYTPAIEAAEAAYSKKLGLPPLRRFVQPVGTTEEERSKLPVGGNANTGFANPND